MVIKQIGVDRQGVWNPRMPQEVKIMKDLNQFGCPAIVGFKGYKRYPRDSVHRIYMEYCPYGDLHRLIGRYRRFRLLPLRCGQVDRRLTLSRQYFPETFLWDQFYYLVQACEAMSIGSAVPPSNFEIVHRDMKPGNGEW